MSPNVVDVDVNVRSNAARAVPVVVAMLGRARAGVRALQGSVVELSKAFGEDPAQDMAKFMEGLEEATKKQGFTFLTLNQQVKQIFDGLKEGAEENLFQTKFLFNQARDSFITFQKDASKGLEDFLLVAFRNNTDKAEAQWKVFVKSLETAYLKMLAKIASAAIQENLLKPALAVAGKALDGLGGIAKDIFGFAEGGLVTRPTLGVLGEAGPELVVPLAKIGGKNVLQDLILGAELAKRGVGPTPFVLAEGNSAASVAAANASIAQATSVALAKTAAVLAAVLSAAEFLKSKKDTADVAQLGVEGGTSAAAFSAAETLGASATLLLAPIAIGKLFESGIPQAAGRSISKFTKKHVFGKSRNTDEQSGEANVFAIRNNPLIPQLGLNAEDLIRQTGGNRSFVTQILNAEMARRGLALDEFGALVPDAGNFHSFEFAEGGLVRRPVLGLIGEAGPEHVLRVDSPASIRALREGLRPIIAELVGASGGPSNGPSSGKGGTTVNVDLRGSFFPDARAVERLFRLLEAHGAGRRVFQPARA